MYIRMVYINFSSRTLVVDLTAVAMTTGRENIGEVVKRLASLQIPKVTWLKIQIYMHENMIWNLYIMRPKY